MSLYLLGHGGENKEGIFGFDIAGNNYFLSSDEFIDMIKLRMRVSDVPITEVFLASCNIADVENGEYAQRIANGLRIPVTVSKNILSINTSGRLTTNLYRQSDSRSLINGFSSLKKFFPNRPHHQVSGSCYFQHLKDCIPR
jgi:hypothetical protein